MRAPQPRLDLRASLAIAAVGVCVLAAGAAADYLQDFEALNMGPLTGQDGFYIPSGTNSIDYQVDLYPINQWGLPWNPVGDFQLVGATGPGGSTFGRAQRDIVLSQSTWRFGFDFAAAFSGDAAGNNIGSFSAQPAPNDWIHLMSWVPGLEGVLYRAFYMAFDAAGAQFPQPGESPGPAWDNLELNHWYRATTTVDFAANLITEVSIEDIDAGGVTTVNPVGWYLEGGAGGSTAAMTAFRFFAGGGNPGNTLAFDNLRIEDLGATPVLPVTWGAIKTHFTSGSIETGARRPSMDAAKRPDASSSAPTLPRNRTTTSTDVPATN